MAPFHPATSPTGHSVPKRVGTLNRNNRAFSPDAAGHSPRNTQVGPIRHGPTAVASLEEFIGDFGMKIAPVTAAIARVAASLRAQNPSLRLPDAFVLAVGEGFQCGCCVYRGFCMDQGKRARAANLERSRAVQADLEMLCWTSNAIAMLLAGWSDDYAQRVSYSGGAARSVR